LSAELAAWTDAAKKTAALSPKKSGLNWRRRNSIGELIEREIMRMILKCNKKQRYLARYLWRNALRPGHAATKANPQLRTDDSAVLIMQGAGAAAGPLLAGLAMSASEHGLSYTLIGTQILMAVFGVYRLTRRAAPPEMHQGAFVVEPLIPVGNNAAAGPFSSQPSGPGQLAVFPRYSLGPYDSDRGVSLAP
jgi:hypothetical protein